MTQAELDVKLFGSAEDRRYFEARFQQLAYQHRQFSLWVEQVLGLLNNPPVEDAPKNIPTGEPQQTEYRRPDKWFQLPIATGRIRRM